MIDLLGGTAQHNTTGVQGLNSVGANHSNNAVPTASTNTIIASTASHERRKHSSLLNSRYSYHVIFSDICKTRFNHLVTRMFLISTILQATSVSFILSSGQASFVERILLVFPKLILLYAMSIVIIITRKNYLHVDSLGYSSLSTQFLGQLISIKIIVYQCIFTIGSLCVALVYGDCGTLQVSLNKLFYYKFFIWCLIPLIYNLQHCLLDQDKLLFIFTRQVQLPQVTISNNILRIMMKSLILSFILILGSPLFIALITTNHTWFIGLGTNIKLFLLSFIVFINFEFINISFNAHMTMGCLHKGKPISSLSSTPMETLISGLTSKKSFTRMSAFQELAYRATSTDSSLRLPIYNNNSMKNYNVWSNILKQCLLVINETNNNVNNYMVNIEKNMNLYDRNLNDHQRYRNNVNKDEILFGNTPVTVNKKEFLNPIPGSVPNIKNINSNDNDDTNTSSQRISLANDHDNILLRKSNRFSRNNENGLFNSHSAKTGHHYNHSNGRFIDSQAKYNESIFTHDTRLIKLFKLLTIKLKQHVISFFFPGTINNNTYINGDTIIPTNSMSIFEIWYLSKERQADKLVPIPIYHAESIITLLGFLINGIEESPRGSVVASVGEVLKVLETSVNVLGKFSDWNPHPNRETQLNRNNNNENNNPVDVISVLYEFSINAFLEIVLKYNILLNDVYLDEDVIKLSRWVLDMCEKQ